MKLFKRILIEAPCADADFSLKNIINEGKFMGYFNDFPVYIHELSKLIFLATKSRVVLLKTR